MAKEASRENEITFGPVEIDLGNGLEEKLKSVIRKLDRNADDLKVHEKAGALARMAIQEWVDWLNNEQRDTRIDDLIVNRMDYLFADIIETVPSKEDIAGVFSLKPNQAKQVTDLFTRSPRPLFRRRILTTLKAAFESALTAGHEPFSLEINKVLDAALKQEEDALHQTDEDFEYRDSGKPLFSGSSQIQVAYSTLESARKLVAHLDRQLVALPAT